MSIGNPYKGEFFIHLGKDRVPLVYNWDAIARMQVLWPKDEYNLTDVEDLAEIIAIGVAHHWPDITPEKIKAFSPPIKPAIDAVNAALCLSFYGSTKPLEALNPPKPGPKTLWSRLSALAPLWAWSRAHSGA